MLFFICTVSFIQYVQCMHTYRCTCTLLWSFNVYFVSFWYVQAVNPETGTEVADNEVWFDFLNPLLSLSVYLSKVSTV